MAYSAMDDEVERYKQLLEDWSARRVPQPSDTPTPAPPRPAGPTGGAPEPPRAKLIRPADEAEEGGRFPKGTILCLDEEELVIYRRPVHGQSYDMVYSLLADGLVKIEGVDLNQHQIVELGQLSPTHLKQLQTDMRWTRDLIAYNCYRLEDGQRIPEPTGTVPAEGYAHPPQLQARVGAARPAAAGAPVAAARTTESGPTPVTPPPLPPKKKTIRRGQRITIKFGDRTWDAVYWGMDSKGTVVAHRTPQRWTLVHLDLNRFKESMAVAPEVDAGLIEQIGQDLRRLDQA